LNQRELNMKKPLSIALTISIIGLIAFAGLASAGMGYGHRGMSESSYGGHHGMENGKHGMGWDTDNLSSEDKDALESESKSFYNETKELRREINAKQLALQAELAKSKSDIAVAKNVQKEISKMKSSLDEKRIEHIAAIKKINPDTGMGSMGRGHRGYCRQ